MIKNIVFALIVALVAGSLYILSMENVVPIPRDENHEGVHTESACFDCHGEGKESARSKDHPPKDRCFKCHKREE